MKRWILLLAALAVVLLVFWLAGKAPSRYALEQECRRFQKDRVDRFQTLSWEIGRKEAQGGQDAAVARLKAEREKVLKETRELSMGGWAVLLLPAGTARPEPAGFLKAPPFDPKRRDDPPLLGGDMEIWLAPRGGLAKTLRSCGLAP